MIRTPIAAGSSPPRYQRRPGPTQRRGELPGPIPDKEPEVRGAITQIHQEVADLLDCPLVARAGYRHNVLRRGGTLETADSGEGTCKASIRVS